MFDRGLRGSSIFIFAGLFAACGEGPTAPEPTSAGDVSLAISDGAHAGNEGFYFLPSMVPPPNVDGTFDPTLSPEVQICAWDGTACAVLLAMFTTDTGYGSERVRVSEQDEHYVVNWRAREVLDGYPLGPGETYRIRVLVDGRELGFADVAVVDRGKKLKSVAADEFVPLKDGRTLPIRFRIEEGALSTASAPAPMPGVSTGKTHSCAVASDGRAFCWGANHRGQLGTGIAGGTWDTPRLVAGGLTWKSVEASLVYTCGLTTDGAAWCWGSNTVGELGIGTSDFAAHPSPEPVAGGLTFESLASLGDHNSSSTCGITTAGDMYCWGLNGSGQLGTGSISYAEATPRLVAGGHAWAGSASLARRYACGVTTGSEVLCWGMNEYGQLGRGYTSAHSSPEPMPGPVSGGHAFQSVTVGATHACGIDTGGSAWCWGRNDDGELGTGTRGGVQSSPQAVSGGHGFARLNAGWLFTCGVDATGTGLCWGVNQYGQLGRGFASGADQPAPGPVTGGHAFETIETGWHHACGLTSDLELWCWGQGSAGQLGNGSTAGSATPVFTIDLDPGSAP